MASNLSLYLGNYLSNMLFQNVSSRLIMVFFWSIEVEVVKTLIEKRPPSTPKVNIALKRHPS
jgi:hypothetical protein